MGLKQEAHEYYRRALAIHHEAANPVGVCTTLLSIAGDTLETGNLDLAEAQITEAAAAANSPRLHGTCEGYLAILALYRRDLELARRHWGRARPLLDVSGAAREQTVIVDELHRRLKAAGFPADSLPGLAAEERPA
jgi:hypothetical protein